MKKLILSLVVFFAMAVVSFAEWTVTPLETGRFYTDSFGQHYVLRLKCVSDGSTGSYVMSLSNLTQNIYLNIMGKFMFSIAADPGTGTTSAITLTITNELGATVWANTSNFTTNSIVLVPGGTYNGYPPHFTDAWTITFNDIGDAGEVYILDLDFLR